MKLIFSAGNTMKCKNLQVQWHNSSLNAATTVYKELKHKHILKVERIIRTVYYLLKRSHYFVSQSLTAIYMCACTIITFNLEKILHLLHALSGSTCTSKSENQFWLYISCDANNNSCNYLSAFRLVFVNNFLCQLLVVIFLLIFSSPYL